MLGRLFLANERRSAVSGVALFLFLILSPGQTAHANAVASVVVAPNGTIYFSDYIRDRIWRLDPQRRLSVFLDGKHTHHLVLDAQGNLYGEHRPKAGGRREADLWRATPGGQVTNLSVPGYEGSVFLRGDDGTIYFLQRCQLVRVAPDGKREVLAGKDCDDKAWTDATLRYGHLHGSLAWAPDGSIIFTDAWLLRKITPQGKVLSIAEGSPANLFEPLPNELQPKRGAGLAVNSQGEIFILESHFDGCIEKLPRKEDESISYLACAGHFWTRNGLSFAHDKFYVVEERGPLPKILADIIGSPRIRRISLDGKQETLAIISSPDTRVAAAAAIMALIAAITLTWKRRRRVAHP
jgi:hypothetical protein